MKLVQVYLKQLHPNQYNPNEMTKERFDKLVNVIKRRGYFQPIVVKQIDNTDQYEIVDGEHRWKALNEIPEYQDKQIDVILLNYDQDSSLNKIDTINFNNLRGKMDAVELAEILQGLSKKFPIDQLKDMLGFTDKEITELIKALDIPEDNIYVPKEKIMDVQESETISIARDIVFQLSFEQSQQYRQAKERLENRENKIYDDKTAILRLCRYYLRQNNFEIPQDLHNPSPTSGEEVAQT